MKWPTPIHVFPSVLLLAFSLLPSSLLANVCQREYQIYKHHSTQLENQKMVLAAAKEQSERAERIQRIKERKRNNRGQNGTLHVGVTRKTKVYWKLQEKYVRDADTNKSLYHTYRQCVVQHNAKAKKHAARNTQSQNAGTMFLHTSKKNMTQEEFDKIYKKYR